MTTVDLICLRIGRIVVGGAAGGLLTILALYVTTPVWRGSDK